MVPHFIGIDVGTGSARAGIFNQEGELLGSAKQDILLFRDGAHVVEQSSNDIWAAVCSSVRSAVSVAGVDPATIVGISFDATCSLVVLGAGGAPLPVGRHGIAERNIIVWMDHRAIDQARRITATKHPVLDYVGGTISPEMETPKLLWLQENLPETFARSWQFMDLTDFLAWKATDSLARSICTVTCKWTYIAHERRWDPSYFRSIGLGALVDEEYARIGRQIVPVGTPLGNGLTVQSATQLGLRPGTRVGAGLIDAHAGGIGTLGGGGPGTLKSRMAYVFGTSACTLSSTTEPIFVPGVWGPYHSVMMPGLWLNEGGQSAAGAAIDHLVRHHPAAAQANAKATAANKGLGVWLGSETERRGGACVLPELVGSVLVVPEFLGNRAPFADPHARAMIAGLSMLDDIESLVSLYAAGMCGIGYGLRQIIQAQRGQGIEVDTIVVSGGAGETALARQILADTTGLAVTSSRSPEPVLLGSAMLGAVAAGTYQDLAAAMEGMSGMATLHQPSANLKEWHDRRYDLFCRLQAVGRDLTGPRVELTNS
ncbi:MAG TPA: FGGY-family carbohydrate kinase [Tianweitania sediminis]|jgi:D-ribulokinase|nr:FGGY-family carbohydrate kinase [Tianweitania sediminis]